MYKKEGSIVDDLATQPLFEGSNGTHGEDGLKFKKNFPQINARLLMPSQFAGKQQQH